MKYETRSQPQCTVVESKKRELERITDPRQMIYSLRVRNEELRADISARRDNPSREDSVAYCQKKIDYFSERLKLKYKELKVHEEIPKHEYCCNRFTLFKTQSYIFDNIFLKKTQSRNLNHNKDLVKTKGQPNFQPVRPPLPDFIFGENLLVVKLTELSICNMS